MGALLNFYLKEETLSTLLETVRKKKEKGVALTISINDETSEFGQNVSGYVSQTKEQQENKTKKYYVGNGAVVWVGDTGVKKADKKEQSTPKQSVVNDDDLPF